MTPKQMSDENDDVVDSGVTDRYIKDAAKAVSYLSSGDFKDMPLKVPTEADDGEMVKVLLTGKAKDGFLTEIKGAECDPEDYEDEEKPKGRIMVMIQGGDKEEEESK